MSETCLRIASTALQKVFAKRNREKKFSAYFCAEKKNMEKKRYGASFRESKPQNLGIWYLQRAGSRPKGKEHLVHVPNLSVAS